MTSQTAAPLLVKLGGELLEGAGLEAMAGAVAHLATKGPLVVVHGGGREVDAELAARGISKRAVGGVRVTNEATLEVVVGVLAGRVNTRFVAACVARGVPAVGLTGADAGVVIVTPSDPVQDTDGRMVDLERVGRPTPSGPPALLQTLCPLGYVPIVASIAADRTGRLFNVNADTFSAHLAARLGTEELVIAGATAGVLDRQGRTIARLTAGEIAGFIADGAATAGMVAKLFACRDAIEAGVRRVSVVDGRSSVGLDTQLGTEIVR